MRTLFFLTLLLLVALFPGKKYRNINTNCSFINEYLKLFSYTSCYFYPVQVFQFGADLIESVMATVSSDPSYPNKCDFQTCKEKMDKAEHSYIWTNYD